MISSDGDNARNVYIVVQFRRLSEIDTLSGKYYAQYYIESKWTEPQIINNYDPEKHWNPKLYIENSFQDATEKISYKTVNEGSSTTIIEKRYVKGMTKFFLNLTHN